jgi:hypothetical protein
VAGNTRTADEFSESWANFFDARRNCYPIKMKYL